MKSFAQGQGFFPDSSEVSVTSEVPVTANLGLCTSTLFLYYPLDGNAVDQSGNGNNGTMSGVVPTANRFGTPNSACWFNGVTSTITVSSAPSMHPVDQMTAAFWFRVGQPDKQLLTYLLRGDWSSPTRQTGNMLDM